MASKLTWKGAEVEAKIIEASREAIDETNEAGAEQAFVDAPFRTGELREGIHVVPAVVSADKVSGQMVSSAAHSLFVELGTVHMAAQPFQRPAADTENPKLAARIKSRLQ